MNSIQVCCGEFIRIILFILNFIFWAAGGIILGIGIYVKVSVSKLDIDVSSETLDSSAVVLISLGCIVFVVGLLGCCGSLTQNRCMLLLYFTLVTFIFLGEIALAIAVYAKKDSVKTTLRDSFEDCMEQFSNQTNQLCHDTINTFQTVLQCCGRDNATDWKIIPDYVTAPPASCCPDDDDDCTYADAYQEGCYTTINQFVTVNAKYIGIAVLGVAVVELIGMCLACYLRTYILQRDDYEPYTV